MSFNVITKGVCWQGSSVVLLARVVNSAGDLLTQTNTTDIAVKVFNSVSKAQTGNPTIGKTDTIFNSLRNDARWTADPDGYNVAVPLPGTCFPEAGNYRAEIEITPVEGSRFFIVYQLQAAEIFSA